MGQRKILFISLLATTVMGGRVWAGPAADAQHWYNTHMKNLPSHIQGNILQACYFKVFAIQAGTTSLRAQGFDVINTANRISDVANEAAELAVTMADLSGAMREDVKDESVRKAWEAAGEAADQAVKQAMDQWLDEPMGNLEAWKVGLRVWQAMYMILYMTMQEAKTLPAKISFGNQYVGLGKPLPKPYQIAKLIWFDTRHKKFSSYWQAEK